MTPVEMWITLFKLRLAIDRWKKALTEWGDTIKIFKDCLDEEGDE